MEKVLFKCYLKYIKENKSNKWKKISKIPAKFWFCYVAIIICSFIPFVNEYIHIMSGERALLFELLSLLICGICFYWSETYIIDIAEESLTEYTSNCMELKEWLAKHNINSNYRIKVIIKRMNAELDKQRGKKEKVIKSIIDITKILIIPIVLAIISEYSKLEEDLITGIAHIITILLVFTIIFILVFLVANTINLFKIGYIAKLEIFVSDLQGVLDLGLVANENKRKPENKRGKYK